MEHKMKILLVDDEARFLETTRTLLEKKGTIVETAGSGAEALDKMLTTKIHVVILDMKMPQMDGIETLKEIKARSPLTEVIILTGHGTVETAVSGLKSGAFDYLTKPVDVDDLIGKAREAFDRRRQTEEKIRVAQSRTLRMGM
jgi:DNA-binding NtrC family response regulator